MYFNRFELMCKCGCNSYNIDKIHLAHINALRQRFGYPLAVNSGCRCKKHNNFVGGVSDSRHISEGRKCDATDLRPLVKGLLNELFLEASKMTEFREVIFYEKKGFIHVATFPEKRFV